MKKHPKYSVGCEVTYKNEDGSENRANICSISQVGMCYVYTVESGNGNKQALFEDKIIEAGKLNE